MTAPKVLVAEDDSTIRELMVEALQILGVDACAAQDGNAALDLVERESIDLILMDCQMPDLDGYEATRRLRRSKDERKANIPVIALTADTTCTHRKLWEAAGMSDCLPKPFVLPTLAEKLLRWLPRNLKKSVASKPPARPAPPIELEVHSPEVGHHDDGPLDECVLDSLLDMQKDAAGTLKFRSILEAFCQRATHVSEWMRAVRAPEELHRQSHQLKSSSLALGARRLSALCARLETLAKSGPLEETHALQARVSEECRIVAQALRRYLRTKLSTPAS